MTARESAIISAFTGILCGPFPAFHQYAEEVMGHPIFSHEFASKELWEQIKEKSKPDFVALCQNVTDDT